MKLKFLFLYVFIGSSAFSQERPLDHLHACLKVMREWGMNENHRVGTGFFIERKAPKDRAGLLVLDSDEMIYFYPAQVVAESKSYSLDIWSKNASQGLRLDKKTEADFDSYLLNPGSARPGSNAMVPLGREELNSENIILFNELALKMFDSAAISASSDLKRMKNLLGSVQTNCWAVPGFRDSERPALETRALNLMLKKNFGENLGVEVKPITPKTH